MADQGRRPARSGRRQGRPAVPLDDRGSYAADLRAFLTASYKMANDRALAGLLRALMAEAQLDEAFGNHFRTAFLQRRRDALAVVVDRAATRGDLPPRPSKPVVLDLVFGTIWYRVLATHGRLDKALVDDLVGVLAGDAAV